MDAQADVILDAAAGAILDASSLQHGVGILRESLIAMGASLESQVDSIPPSSGVGTTRNSLLEAEPSPKMRRVDDGSTTKCFRLA